MQILNLDALLPVQRSIKLKGKEHPVQELSLEGFLQMRRDFEALGGREATEEENLELSIRHAMRMLPTLSEGDIRALTPEQTTALVEFLNTEAQAQATAGAQGASEGVTKN